VAVRWWGAAGSSFWNMKVSWRVFFCCIITFFYMFAVALSGDGVINPSYVMVRSCLVCIAIAVMKQDK
jgi:hypothetical protein